MIISKFVIYECVKVNMYVWMYTALCSDAILTRNEKKKHDIEIFLRTKIIIISNVIPTQKTERTTNNNPSSNFFYLTTRINQLHFIPIALPPAIYISSID